MDATGDLPLDGPLWRFALATYGQPGVPEACLCLQEAWGLDIPLMLAALHADREGRAVDAAGLGRMETAIAEWRDIVIRPLRQIRSRMKTHGWMQAHPPVAPLREAVKALELRGEQIELAVLDRITAALAAADPAGPEAVIELLRHRLDAPILARTQAAQECIIATIRDRGQNPSMT